MTSLSPTTSPHFNLDWVSSVVWLEVFSPVSNIFHDLSSNRHAENVQVPAGGPVGEAVANYFTIRNRGIREPEFRLPAMAISIITAPLGLILYGVGLQNKMHFMVPITGIGLRE